MSATPQPNVATRRSHRVLAAALVVSGLAVVWLAALAHRIPYFSVDLAITRDVQRLHTPWLVLPMEFLSAIGFPPLVAIVYGAIALAIVLLGRRLEGVMAAVTGLGGAALNHLGKAIVGRPRPDGDLVHVGREIHSSTFPAGHVLNATAFFGFLLFLVTTHMAPSWRRATLQGLLVLIIAGMGAARIYSGEHWPSDVLGGYLIGWMWVAGAAALYRRIRRRGVRQAFRRASRDHGRVPTVAWGL